MRFVLLLRILLQGWWVLIAGLVVFATANALLGGPAFIDTIAAVTMVMSFAGFFVGTGTANLRNWPAATLVPGYSRGLFAATLAVLGIALSAWAAVCILLGKSVVLLGPGLLVGSFVALCLVPLRHYAQFFGAMVIFLPVLLGSSVLALATRMGWYDGTNEVLARPAAQVTSLALAGLALWMLRRVIDSPVRAGPPKSLATGSYAVQPSGLPVHPVSSRLQTPRVKVVCGSAAVVGLALLLRLSGASPFLAMLGLMLPWGCLVLHTGVFQLHHIHAVFHFLWLHRIADSRAGVARQATAMILLRAFAWLPAGLAGAIILTVGTEAPGSLFDEVLIVQTYVLIVLAVSLVGARRLPIGRVGWLYSYSGAPLGVVILASWAVRPELEAVGHSVLVSAVVASASVVGYLAVRTLSRAEVLV